MDDNLLGFFTDAPFGTPEHINSFKNMDKEFCLVEKVAKTYPYSQDIESERDLMDIAARSNREREGK